jgi:ribonuclease R
METLKRKILDVVRRKDYTPLKRSALAQKLSVNDEQYPDFDAALKDLQTQGKITVGPKNLILLPTMSNRVTGTFRANARGFGFVIPLEPTHEGDLFIGPHDTAEAMDGDTVVAKIVRKGHQGGRQRIAGMITEILERGHNRFVGTLQRKGREWIVQPEGKGYFEPVIVDDVTAKGARVGDKVILEILQFPANDLPARGVILEVLGRAGQYDTEIRAILAQYNLRTDFDRECLDQARNAAAGFNPDNLDGRYDATGDVIITIDPPDAKDFDDAISLRRDRDGNWVLGVHIADVCAFIPMKSPLDVEARQRGNSVYLPGRVIPMLPEALSNGICSLQPNQRRFTKTAYITYDPQGKVLGSEFANSVINSNARLTYEQANDILEGRTKGFDGEVVGLVKDMETLARAIDRRRAKNGMLHLDLPETELDYDADGHVIDAHPADASYPHTIIEMFMVEANEAVAGLLDRFRLPFIRRIHPDPSPGGRKEMGRFVRLCGMKVPRDLNRSIIQDLLASVKGSPSSFAVNMFILRSLQKAEYSPLHIGHFALASKHYCHFTSPIRRYADLTVHRLLHCYLEHRINLIGLEEVLPEGELMEIGKHISWTEQQAASAERELKTILILQMLTKHVGDTLEGVVSGLTNFGVFVQCIKYGIEGMIEPGDLGLDEWKYDERNQAIVGQYSRESVNLGEPMPVRIVAVNVAARQLSLAPVEPLTGSRDKAPKKPRHKR